MSQTHVEDGDPEHCECDACSPTVRPPTEIREAQRERKRRRLANAERFGARAG